MNIHIKNITADSLELRDMIFDIGVNYSIHKDTYIFNNANKKVEDKIDEILEHFKNKNQSIIVTKGII